MSVDPFVIIEISRYDVESAAQAKVPIIRYLPGYSKVILLLFIEVL